jgi:tRNA dimethylallyltransferase
LLALLGPTASGKSEIAIELAQELEAPILSVDSMQVYRGMDIGTAKPTAEEQRRVPHYMIDLVEPEEAFTVAQFQREARELIESERHPIVLVVGGSGLHFRAVVDPLVFPPHDSEVRADLEAAEDPLEELLGIDPNAGNAVDLDNRRRVIRAVEVYRLTGMTPTMRAQGEEAEAIRTYKSWYEFQAVGVDPGAQLEARVAARSKAMIDRGLLDEVASVAGRLGPTASAAVGYRQLLPVVEGEITVETGIEVLTRATVGLAHRQRTFFRKDPRITWVAWSQHPERRLLDVRKALRI